MSFLACSLHSYVLASLEVAKWSYFPRLLFASQLYPDFYLGAHACGLSGLSFKALTSLFAAEMRSNLYPGIIQQIVNKSDNGTTTTTTGTTATTR